MASVQTLKPWDAGACAVRPCGVAPAVTGGLPAVRWQRHAVACLERPSPFTAYQKQCPPQAS